MGCASDIMKCVIHLFNCIPAVVGIILMINATSVLKTAPLTYVIYMYVIGGAGLCAALLGFCGICHEHVCMTISYAAVILTLLVAQICNKFYSYDYVGYITKYAREDVEKTWLNEIRTAGAMNTTQQTYTCCGRTGPTDYAAISREIPNSCYPQNVVNSTVFETGCIEAAEDKFIKLFKHSSDTEWITLGVMAVMFAFAVFMVIRFRNKQSHYYY